MTKDIDISIIEYGSTTLVVLLVLEGFAGVFRIIYKDQSRKNALYPDRKVISCYYETGAEYWKAAHQMAHISDTFSIENCTNAMLWVERHNQWLLEETFRRFKKL